MTRQQSIDKMLSLAERLNEIVDAMKQRKLALMSTGFGEG